MQDSYDVCKVFLAIALGEDGHSDNSPIWEPDLQIARWLLCGD